MTTKPISRSSGRSATASSAYRNASKIFDERTGTEYDYTKKSGVVYSACFDKDNNQLDRNELWNLAESSEKRKDARTAREYIIAIPDELMPDYPEPIPDLNEEEKKDSVKVAEHKLKVKQYEIDSQKAIEQAKDSVGIITAIAFAENLTHKFDVAVDVAVHAPDGHGNNKNWHAHIMSTTRKFELKNGEMTLGGKADIELSNRKLKELNKPKNQEQIKELRKYWQDIANYYLEIVDSKERIDCRSYADQGKDQIPTTKLGWKASAMERKGIKTDRGDINRDIINRNKQIKKLKEEIEEDKQLLLEERKQQRLRNEKFEPVIEPLPVKKNDVGWSLYDNYKLLSNIHNVSIDNIKNGLYNKQEATEVMQYFYEIAQQVYADVESNKDNLHLSKTQIEKVKKSTDEIKNNYSNFINKTILKDEQSIIDARNKTDEASSKCLSNEHQKPIETETAETKPEQPNPSTTFRP